MKKNWVEQVKNRIAKKAGINGHNYKNIEALVGVASKHLAIPNLVKCKEENMISYTRRLVMHFDLGHDCDAKVPDTAARKRRQSAWQSYKDRRMGFR
jgi:hypothetical protein